MGDHALAIRLRRARLEAGWTTRRAAEAIGVSERRLERMEAGSAFVRASILVKASRVYGRPPVAMLPDAADLRLAHAVAALDASEVAYTAGA